MRAIPYEKFEIRTRKNREQVVQLLQANTDANRLRLFGGARGKVFLGKVSSDRFKISPIITCHNSFLPILCGRICQDDGTTVDVRMRMRGAVVIFVTAWLLMCAGFCVATTVAMVIDKTFDLFMVIPYLMLLFGYGMMMVFFNHSADKARDELLFILGEQSDRPTPVTRR